MFSFATRTRPAISTASSSSTGAIILQGPHHGAHRSSSTGRAEPSTAEENLASVTLNGSLDAESGDLHRPQTGISPSSIFWRGTRLVAPQAGQRISWGSAICCHYRIISARDDDLSTPEKFVSPAHTSRPPRGATHWRRIASIW